MKFRWSCAHLNAFKVSLFQTHTHAHTGRRRVENHRSRGMNVWVISTLFEPEWVTRAAVTTVSKSCLNSCIPSHPFILSLPLPLFLFAVKLILVLLVTPLPLPTNVLVWRRASLMEKECRSEVSHPFDCRQVSARCWALGWDRDTLWGFTAATAADLWTHDSLSESLWSFHFFAHILSPHSRVIRCWANSFQWQAW